MMTTANTTIRSPSAGWYAAPRPRWPWRSPWKAGQSQAMANMALRVASSDTSSTSASWTRRARRRLRVFLDRVRRRVLVVDSLRRRSRGRHHERLDTTAFADAAFEMATRAAAMGDEAERFTDDDEAEGG